MADQASFGFRNSASKEVTWLSFEMTAGDLSRRWGERVLKESRKKKILATPLGGLYVDEPAVRKEIERFGSLIVARQPDVPWAAEFPRCVQSPYIEKRVLLSLLEYCRPREKREPTRELAMWVREYLTMYNTDVHFDICLRVLRPWLVSLAMRDFKLFEADRRDGWLYLEYLPAGRSSLVAFEEKVTVGIQPQRTYSANVLLSYRESLDMSQDIAAARAWVGEALGMAADDPRLAIGMIPIGRPIHSLQRSQVQELVRDSDSDVQFRYEIDGRIVGLKEIALARRQSREHSFRTGLVLMWTNRADGIHFVKRVADTFWGERWRIGQFFVWIYYNIIVQTYYNLRPVVVFLIHRMTWPIRKIYYFTSYQYRKRILKLP